MNPSISLSISVLFKLLVPEGNSRCFKILSLRLIDVLFCLFSKLFWTLSLLIGVGVGEGVGEGVGVGGSEGQGERARTVPKCVKTKYISMKMDPKGRMPPRAMST